MIQTQLGQRIYATCDLQPCNDCKLDHHIISPGLPRDVLWTDSGSPAIAFIVHGPYHWNILAFSANKNKGDTPPGPLNVWYIYLHST